MLNKKNLIINTERDLDRHYPDLSNLLGAYFAADVDNDIYDVNHTVNEFCNTKYPEIINKTISQAKKVLEIDPFPATAIETATNLWISQSYDEEIKAEKVKQWLHNVLNLLEMRVTGKL